MSKIVDLGGFALIAIMILSFVSFLKPIGIESGTSSPVFWICAVGVLGIIIYRKMKNKQEEKTE
ncbi:MAG: hypothetical protein HOK63_06310 [Thaumarchaeota archaeon]|jgi:hypothetical protein|nr:hypothetical protein [Nitrososphaerota archaeon]MBT5843226.1 hypothetical protein [Nitrososphaerota archaeon]MBT6469242.1 hypothetical protein [Nitrososphaerota archaeon]